MKIITPEKKSYPVTLKDLPKVFWDSLRIKWAMRKPFPGRYPWASSVSHCQIEAKRPLRFFVVDREGGISEAGTRIPQTGIGKNKKRLIQATKLKKYFGARTIINPEIIETSKSFMKMKEACMSFPEAKPRPIKRHEVVKLRYWTFFGPKTRNFYLFRAALIQHEIDHMDNVTYHDRYFHTFKN